MRMQGASVILAALICLTPVAAMAKETAPLTLKTQQERIERREDAGRLENFGENRAYLGVSAYDKWLFQARIGGLMLNLRLYAPDGAAVTFQENLCQASTEGEKDIRLCIRAGSREGGLLMQMDQHAVDVLERVGITEIVLTDTDMYIQETYLTEEIAALREALSLRDKDEICLTGRDQPVTIVSEDGVRRQAAP